MLLRTILRQAIRRLLPCKGGRARICRPKATSAWMSCTSAKILPRLVSDVGFRLRHVDDTCISTQFMTAYDRPIAVGFVHADATAKNHAAMRFDTTDCETKEFEAAMYVWLDSRDVAIMTGSDCTRGQGYVEATDGYTLDSSNEEREKAGFFHVETGCPACTSAVLAAPRSRGGRGRNAL